MPEKITDFGALDQFYKDNPGAYPQNNSRTFWPLHPDGTPWTKGQPNWGFSPGDSSKMCAANSDETLLLAREFNTSYLGVWSIPDKKFLGSVPVSASNGMDIGMNVMWDRRAGATKNLLFSIGGALKCQIWDQPQGALTIATPPNGWNFAYWGGDGTVSDDGRFIPVMVGSNLLADGSWKNVMCGVCDLSLGKLSTLFTGKKPDALDISPDGRWLLYADGEDFASTEPNRLYDIKKLFAGTVSFLPIPSAATAGSVKNDQGIEVPGIVKSVGHNGFARTLDGDCVFIGQDNRNDTILSYSPAKNEIKAVFNLASLGYPLPNMHFSRHAPPGYTIVSTYNMAPGAPWANQILLLELATGKTTKICDTLTKNTDKSNEATAQASWVNAKWVYWGNNASGAGNLEAVRELVPSVAPVPPVVTPPTPKPKYRGKGHVDGKSMDFEIYLVE